MCVCVRLHVFFSAQMPPGCIFAIAGDAGLGGGGIGAGWATWLAQVAARDYLLRCPACVCDAQVTCSFPGGSEPDAEPFRVSDLCEEAAKSCPASFVECAPCEAPDCSVPDWHRAAAFSAAAAGARIAGYLLGRRPSRGDQLSEPLALVAEEESPVVAIQDVPDPTDDQLFAKARRRARAIRF